MSNLDANIKGIDVRTGHQYSKNLAEVTLDISDGNGGRKDIVVTYPVQDERHLTMLMREKVSAADVIKLEDISIVDAHELSKAIKDVILKKD
jgi:hypothetical protein